MGDLLDRWLNEGDITALTQLCTPRPSTAARLTIAPTHLTSSGSAVDGTTFNTASITPTANTPVYIGIAVRRTGSTPSDPTSVAGCNLTWAQEETQTYASSTVRRVIVWRGIGASPSAGALTITFPETETCCAWSVVECRSADTSGTAASGATLQSVPSTTTSGTTITSTLLSFESAKNVHLCFVALDTVGTATAGSGFANLGSNGPGENLSITSMWAVNDTTCDPTYATAIPGVISLEVKAG